MVSLARGRYKRYLSTCVKRYRVRLQSIRSGVPNLFDSQSQDTQAIIIEANFGQEVLVVEHRVRSEEVSAVVSQIRNMRSERDGTRHVGNRHRRG